MSPENPRIIMLLLEFHPIFTGHGIYLQQLIKFLNKYDCDVSILAADYNSLPSFENVDGLNVYRFRCSPNEKYWEFKLTWRVINFLFANRNRYDILHIHGHLDIYGLLTLFNQLLGKHTISQMVLLGADDPMTLMSTYKFMKWRYKILLLMDRFLCISKILGESYKQAGLPMGKLTYIPQGVDIDRFTPVASASEKKALKGKFAFSNFDNIVIFVGAIVKRKGVDWLVDAWCQVQKEHPNALLLLIGQDKFDGTDINQLELDSFVNELVKSISDNKLNVHFTGKQVNINEYLQCADVFVLPSRKEGFGNVILEGMATGLPVVVTYMDGVSSETVVPGRNGFIVNSVSELSQSISTLLNDSTLSRSMGHAGREMAVNDFSMSEIAGRYAKVYREITGSVGA